MTINTIAFFPTTDRSFMVRRKLECDSVAGKTLTVTEANKLKILR